jgi:hypothetical protein
VMFRRGGVQVLSSAAGIRAARDDAEWIFETLVESRLVVVRLHAGIPSPRSAALLEQARIIVICGFVGCDLKLFDRLVAALANPSLPSAARS